ncbi:MAG: aldo/keto reductase [Puniceicoccaceae bacterium]
MKHTATHSEACSRRHFLKTGATGLAAASLIPMEAIAGDKLSKLPLRRYGRTGLDISAMIGATTWDNSLVPVAMKYGVNYWHKAQKWTDDTYPTALKNADRESYYLEVVIDRVGGRHRTGKIDEESHYQYVKDSLKKLSVGYYDVFKFHFGYHSVEDYKKNTGMVRAFERLKKEGLVKHLTISQHHYNDIGGDMAYEIVDHLIDHSPYEAAQFFYNYGGHKEIDEVLAKAKKNDFGTIAMKSMRGVGRAGSDDRFKEIMKDPRFKGSSPAIATVKWLMSNPNLTAAVVMMDNFQELEEDMGAAIEATMAMQDKRMLQQLAAFNKGMTCLLCADCVSKCPESIAMDDIFRYERYAMDYHQLAHARRNYQALTKNGTACIACGDCVPACPADIDIVSKLKDVHALLG